MDYGLLPLEDMKRGFRYEQPQNAYVCNYCEKAFTEGQIYDVDGKLYTAERAAAEHIQAAHGGSFTALLQTDTKYNTLTDNQKELLALFHGDTPDKETAQKLGISVSTVRHQKFTFREKAKQAKLYLALFELAFTDKPVTGESLVPIHDNATYYDDRYVITEEEKNRILSSVFYSLEPLKLKAFPPKEKKKVVILTRIAEKFENGREYTEKEVNNIIKEIFDDYTTLRRFLIMYGFIDRSQDGARYWKI